MLESEEAESAQGSVVVEEYSVYVSEWCRLVQMEFDASIGESSGDGNANSSRIHGVLPAVRVEPASKANVVRCYFEAQHSLKFHVGESVWFSRSHPCRVCWKHAGVIDDVSRNCMEVSFKPDRMPLDMRSGLWCIDSDFATFSRDCVLAELRSFAF